MSISRVVPATVNGPMLRVIGALDVDGNGLAHELPSVGLFVLLDDATVAQAGQPAFGFHPHAGATILSIPLEGGQWSSAIRGEEEVVCFGPGQVAVAHAGSGLVHDERTVSTERSSMIQLALANFHNSEPRFELTEPTELVADTLWLLYSSDKPQATVWLGTLRGGAVSVTEGLHEVSWVLARAGSALVVDGQALPPGSIALLEPGTGRVQISGQGTFLLGSSEQPEAPPEKILFASGFSIARTAQEARAIEARWKANPW